MKYRNLFGFSASHLFDEVFEVLQPIGDPQLDRAFEYVKRQLFVTQIPRSF